MCIEFQRWKCGRVLETTVSKAPLDSDLAFFSRSSSHGLLVLCHETFIFTNTSSSCLAQSPCTCGLFFIKSPLVIPINPQDLTLYAMSSKGTSLPPPVYIRFHCIVSSLHLYSSMKHLMQFIVTFCRGDSTREGWWFCLGLLIFFSSNRFQNHCPQMCIYIYELFHKGKPEAWLPQKGNSGA